VRRAAPRMRCSRSQPALPKEKSVQCTLFLLHKPLFRQIFALVFQHVVKKLLSLCEGDVAHLRVVHEGGNNVRAGCVHASLNNFFNGFFEGGRGLRAATPHPAHCIRHLPLKGKAFGFAFDNKLGSVDTCLPLEGKVRRAAPRMRCSRSQPALLIEKRREFHAFFAVIECAAGYQRLLPPADRWAARRCKDIPSGFRAARLCPPAAE